MSRCMFVWGDAKQQLIPYPSELVPAAQYEEIKQRLVEDLRQISTLSGEMQRTPEATKWGIKWYEKHYK